MKKIFKAIASIFLRKKVGEQVFDNDVIELSKISLGTGYLPSSSGKPRRPIRITEPFVKVGVEYSWEEYLFLSHLDLMFPPKYEYIEVE